MPSAPDGRLTRAQPVSRGLDVSREVDAVRTQRLRETVLIEDKTGLQAVAVCHIGRALKLEAGPAS
jgi:hypothetical protein